MFLITGMHFVILLLQRCAEKDFRALDVFLFYFISEKDFIFVLFTAGTVRTENWKMFFFFF